jgi:hypothetical protein
VREIVERVWIAVIRFSPGPAHATIVAAGKDLSRPVGAV